AYDIYVSDAEILDFTGVEPTYAGVTGTSKVIDLLQRNTTYYVYLRCNCGEGVVTDWSLAGSETTLDNVPDCGNSIVANGTKTHTSTPFDFYNTDGTGTLYKAQLLYPASLLAENGVSGTIKGVTFYDKSGATKNLTATAWTIKVGTTTATDLSAGFCPDELTTVYSGNYLISAGVVSFAFDNDFDYTGDNLVVEISCIGTGGNWYGSGGATGYYGVDGIGSTYSSVSGYNNFVPKTTFAYCVPALPCPAVDAPVATDVTDTEATISWNAGTGDFATSYDLVISDTAVTDFEGVTLAADDVTETSFNAVGLSANTHYYSYVRVNCVNDIYDDGSSVWSPAEEFTTELPCLKPENFVAGSPLSDRVELSWTKKGTAVDWRIYVDTFDVEYTAWLPADTVFVNAADCQIVEDTVTYLLTGLQPVKAYTLALQSDCGEVDGLSKLALNTPSFTTLSNVTDIDTMVIHSGETMVCTIDRNAKTINATVRKGTDLTGLFFDITFAESHCTAYLNGEELVYPFDFSEPVTARVFAQDTNVFADWTITVVEEPCATPFNVAATDIERRTANITWNIGDASTSFDFVISETELEDPATGTIQNITATNVEGACTYAVTGLTRGTHYYVYLRTNCGETYGQWRGTDFITKSLTVCDLDVTVCDGIATDIYTPLYGSYTDNTQRVQTVYPASMLSDLTGKTISKLKYFVNNGGSTGEYGSWENATFNIRMMPYSSTTLYSLASTTSAQVVYSGTLKASVEEGMEINLTTPYTYTGGNLLIEFELPTETGYSDCAFYGVSESNSYASYLKLGSSTSYLHFRPKVEFLSCEESEACPEVTDVTVADIDVNSATVTWTESTGDYANASDIYYSTTEVEDFTGVEPQLTGVYGNSAVITGLSQYTIYYVYVRTHCDAEGHDDGISQWSEGTSFRTLSPCRVPGTPEATITGKHTATVAWTNTSESAQADNFTYILSATPIAEDALETAEATETAYSNTTVDVTNLLCETTYHFYVKNVCTGDVNCSSPWDSCQFTMPVAMPAVINLQAFDIASNAFTAVWESDLANFADETEWEVACVPAGGTPETWTSVSAREHFAIGLTP
ncbi:MAG: fibronectin type III domain-containing protein, partial [bacterium]|nr:fibronectin type III domain-containing protein [Candidatus Colousia faecequi]